MEDRFLPGVPGEQIEAIYNAAPGKEIESGKFDSPESSAALAANTFGFFLNRPGELPPLPGCEDDEWPATSLYVEREVRFPWSGGRHPWLDALVVTPSALIGVESKRFEPFRTKRVSFSETYLRPVWGDRMKGYEGIRDSLNSSEKSPMGLDSVQLVKHALACGRKSDQAVNSMGSRRSSSIFMQNRTHGRGMTSRLTLRRRPPTERKSAGSRQASMGTRCGSLPVHIASCWRRGSGANGRRFDSTRGAVMQRFSP